jgi:hypothetical protein
MDILKKWPVKFYILGLIYGAKYLGRPENHEKNMIKLVETGIQKCV